MMKYSYFVSARKYKLLLFIFLVGFSVTAVHNFIQSSTNRFQQLYVKNILSEDMKTENDSCSPSKHFVYVKTHKTGSESLFRTLYKYARKQHLRVVWPKPWPNIGGYPGRVQRRFLFRDRRDNRLFQADQFYNVMVNHVRFNGTLLRSLFSPETKYFSGMRKPWDEFQSAFYFYYAKPPKLFRSTCSGFPYFHVAGGKAITLREYLDLAFVNLSASVPFYFRSKNYQAHDLGLDPMLDEDVEIERAIKKLDSEIDLMLISDYMYESLVLLKDLLCLDWMDLLLPNDGSTHRYEYFDIDKDPEASDKFRKMYKLDIALYEHFNASLWKKVDKYGREKMQEDVNRLKEIHRSFLSNKPKTVRLIPTVSLTEEAESIKLFKSIQNNYNVKTMTDILRKKLKTETNLNEEQIMDMSDYMVANSGGCPI